VPPRILIHFPIAALVVFIAGCASDAPGLHDKYAYQSPPQAQSKPAAVQPPAESYPPASVRAGLSEGYAAGVLTGTYSDYLPVRRFISDMVSKHGFTESYLNGLFSQAHRLDSVIRLENPAPANGSSRPSVGSWTRYRNKFLTEQHIQNGTNFWLDNAEVIRKASVTYGVDPEYIVAIIGVETYFGHNFGKTCIFDSLTTLSFDTYRRSKFFMSELESFLLMAREEGFDPLEPKGSWAGAMGYGQFMPSSFRRLAIDFNSDGRRDLWHPHDAIGSVAHYFSKNGWHYNNPVARPGNGSRAEGQVIELSTYDGLEHWRTYPNFKVIKRYNNSDKYAMAVHQLAQAIRQRVETSGAVIRSSSAK
jgi:membrane-bound lytic murein transglycosylase B